MNEKEIKALIKQKEKEIEKLKEQLIKLKACHLIITLHFERDGVKWEKTYSSHCGYNHKKELISSERGAFKHRIFFQWFEVVDVKNNTREVFTRK